MTPTRSAIVSSAIRELVRNGFTDHNLARKVAERIADSIIADERERQREQERWDDESAHPTQRR